jgi:hypothetical protein
VLNKINDIREFKNHHLGDIPHTIKVEPDPERGSNGFEGHAIIATPFNKYKMSAFSSHLPPPAGAPAECASLGPVIFFDPVDDTRVIGPRGDRVLLDVSRRIHHREFSDAIAVARREVAEAGPDVIKAAQAKLGALVSAAVKWGVSGSVPMAPSTKDAEPPAVPTTAPLAPIAAAPAAVSAPVAPGVPADEPLIGTPIVFICNPGEGAAGMTTVPGAVTRVWSNGQVGLQMWIDDHEIAHRPKVHRHGTDAGGGRVHTHGCWAPAPWYAALISRLDALEKSLGAIDALVAENKQLVERIAALEDKPKRGRPAKVDGDKADGEATKEPELSV